eukprot:PhF_6_TR24432/c0_g2_i1/m.33790
MLPTSQDEAVNSILARLHYEKQLRKATQEMRWYFQGPQPPKKCGTTHNYTNCKHNPDNQKIRPLPCYDMRPWWAKQFGDATAREIVYSMEPWNEEKTYSDLAILAKTMPGAPPASKYRKPDELDNMMNDMRIDEHVDAYTSLATHTAAQRHHSQRGFGRKVKTPKSSSTPPTEIQERARWRGGGGTCPYCRCGQQAHEIWCVANDARVVMEQQGGTPLRQAAVAGRTLL